MYPSAMLQVDQSAEEEPHHDVDTQEDPPEVSLLQDAVTKCLKTECMGDPVTSDRVPIRPGQVPCNLVLSGT
jgi:hypothetical protein